MFAVERGQHAGNKWHLNDTFFGIKTANIRATNCLSSENIVNRVITGAAWMVAFRMFSRGIGIASTLVLARLLDTTDFGIVAIAFTISAALNSVSNVGVTENLVRYKTVGRPELDTGFTIQLVKGVITGALLLAAAPIAASWFSEPRLTNVIYVLAIIFALSGIENIGIINFRRDMRFDREFQLSIIERVLTFAATLTAALLLRSYWALVIGMLVAKIVRVIATYVMEPYRPKLGLHAWGELAGFSMWMWLSSLVYIVWIRADPLVVGSQVSKAVLGLYVVALDIALLPATEIMEPIGAVLFAGFAAEHNAGSDPRGKTFSLAVSLMTVMAPIALIISAASTEIVGVLLGPKVERSGAYRRNSHLLRSALAFQQHGCAVTYRKRQNPFEPGRRSLCLPYQAGRALHRSPYRKPLYHRHFRTNHHVGRIVDVHLHAPA